MWVVAALSLGCAAAPVSAQTVESALARFDAVVDREAFPAAASDVIAFGGAVVPQLTRRLIAADTDAERVRAIYLLARILGQAKFDKTPVEIPAELRKTVGRLLMQPSDVTLEANLANLAAVIGAYPSDLGAGLMALLQRTDEANLRATTSAAIVNQGAGVLPLVQEALSHSDDDRFGGDLARILRGTPLPDGTIAALTTLLRSNDPEARQAAGRTLGDAGAEAGTGAGVEGSARLDAALRDLEDARTDVELNAAASDVERYSDGSERVADALGRAFARADRAEEFRQIALALQATGAPGAARYLSLIAASRHADELDQLRLSLGQALLDDPRTASAFLTVLRETPDEIVAKVAANALVTLRATSRPLVKAALADKTVDPGLRLRLYQVRTMSALFPDDSP